MDHRLFFAVVHYYIWHYRNKFFADRVIIFIVYTFFIHVKYFQSILFIDQVNFSLL
jgi:hypothetical protein